MRYIATPATREGADHSVNISPCRGSGTGDAQRNGRPPQPSEVGIAAGCENTMPMDAAKHEPTAVAIVG